VIRRQLGNEIIHCSLFGRHVRRTLAGLEFGAADRPLRLGAVEDVLNGSMIDETTFTAAVAAARADPDPPGNIHFSGAYRPVLIGTMLEQALKTAI
jgi:CO/xanthine dehydrogenase FAD-binding subunit